MDDRDSNRRIRIAAGWPKGYELLAAVDAALEDGRLEGALRHMVMLRVAQLNQCAYCTDMHWKDARVEGVDETKLSLLAVWRDAPMFTEREQAALALAEAITCVAESHVPDEVVRAAAEHFDDEELSQLVFQILAINSWTRLGVLSRLPAGRYTPKERAGTA